NGIGRERTEAHGRDVVDTGVIRLPASRASDAHPEIGVSDLDRRCRMSQPGIAGSVDVFDGAERSLVLVSLGALIDEGPVLPAERHFVMIALYDVLPNLGPEALQQKAQVTDHRIVAQDRMPMLTQIAHTECEHRAGNE